MMAADDHRALRAATARALFENNVVLFDGPVAPLPTLQMSALASCADACTATIHDHLQGGFGAYDYAIGLPGNGDALVAALCNTSPGDQPARLRFDMNDDLIMVDVKTYDANLQIQQGTVLLVVGLVDPSRALDIAPAVTMLRQHGLTVTLLPFIAARGTRAAMTTPGDTRTAFIAQVFTIDEIVGWLLQEELISGDTAAGALLRLMSAMPQ